MGIFGQKLLNLLQNRKSYLLTLDEKQKSCKIMTCTSLRNVKCTNGEIMQLIETWLFPYFFVFLSKIPMKEFISSLKTISTTMILRVDDSIIYKEEMYMSRKQIVYFMGKYISMDWVYLKIYITIMNKFWPQTLTRPKAWNGLDNLFAMIVIMIVFIWKNRFVLDLTKIFNDCNRIIRDSW